MLAWAAENPFRRNVDSPRDPSDRVREQHGNSFLTKRREASHEQIDTGYPRMAELLRCKLDWEPKERSQSDWYQRYEQKSEAEL